MREVTVSFPARPYQQAVIDWFRDGQRSAFEVWHRKAGKDRTATFIESELAFKRVGLYWHALPKYEDARKVIWDAITPEGQRLIDVNFPKEIIKRRLDHEMKLELVNGSIWQPVGADNYDSLVGAFPVHVTWSEFALMTPNARNYIKPALAMSKGTELVITTTRGYNHAFELYQHAKQSPQWHTSLLTVDDTRILSKEILDEERRTMPDELFRQEYYCDWSAANVGSILGRYVEQAEKSGRITEIPYQGESVIITSDIGFRDTASWWYWIPRIGGFDLIDYDEGTGWDAQEWIPHLKEKGYPIRFIWLPHDARAKTFATRHSVVEQFLQAFGHERVGVVPLTKKQDQINASRLVIQKCRFHVEQCAKGLNGLREWSFDYDEEKKAYSREPRHDWASHPGDAFAQGAVIMKENVQEQKQADAPRSIAVFHNTATLNDMWETAHTPSERI